MTSDLTICPVLHPISILRGQTAQEPIQLEYLNRIKEHLNGTETDLTNAYDPPPNTILYPTVDDIERFFDGDFSLGASVDIEAAGRHIVCVGITRISDLHTICIRFRSAGGGIYDSSFLRIYRKVELLDRFFSEPSIPKVFHFGVSYDIPELTFIGWDEDGTPYGFNVNGAFSGEIPDTLLAQATALAGLPKDLATCAKMHLGLPNWKHLVNEDDEVGEEK